MKTKTRYECQSPAAQAERRRLRVAAGLCAFCGQERGRVGYLCVRCCEKHAAEQRRRKLTGEKS